MIDRLITPLRTVVRDLVAKRLWPIAIVLVVALVAVPLVIGSSGSDAPGPVAAEPATPAAGPDAESAITVVEPAVIGRSRPGAVHDPFYDPPKPKDTTTSTASPSTVSSSAPTPSAPSAKPAAQPRPASTAPPSPAPTPGTSVPAEQEGGPAVYHARLRWGADDQAAVRGVSRLQPLGGTTNPALVYLGTTEGGARAVFLLGPKATSDVAQSDCAEKTCRVIALKPGQSISVGVLGEDGAEAGRYTLVIDSIDTSVATSEAAALEQRAHVHPAGREVLRAMILDPATAAAIGQFTYDRTAGAVVAITAP
jgi:hypothetical protein